MKKIIEWFKESNRWKHLLFAIPIGLICNSWYMALIVGLGVGGSMEFKDKACGGEPDVIYAGLTTLGVLIGYSIQFLIRLLLCIAF